MTLWNSITSSISISDECSLQIQYEFYFYCIKLQNQLMIQKAYSVFSFLHTSHRKRDIRFAGQVGALFTLCWHIQLESHLACEILLLFFTICTLQLRSASDCCVQNMSSFSLQFILVGLDRCNRPVLISVSHEQDGTCSGPEY